MNRRQEFVKCESAAYWSAIDEIVQGEVQGEVRAEGEKVYSYCAEKGSDGGRSPHYPGLFLLHNDPEICDTVVVRNLWGFFAKFVRVLKKQVVPVFPHCQHSLT